MSFASFEIGRAFDEQLAASLPLERCRTIAEEEGGFSRVLWQELAAAGWLELGASDDAVPFVEVVSACESAGRRLLPGPFSLTASFVLPLAARFFPAIVTGVVSGEKLTVPILPQLVQTNGYVSVNPVGAGSTPDGIVLSGVFSAVPYATCADAFLVPFQDEEQLVGLALVERSAVGVDVDSADDLDLTAPAAQVRFADVNVSRADLATDVAVRAALAQATVAFLHTATAESVGGIGAVLEQTVHYVSGRSQFGVPVGSFQALKHALADVAVAYELGRGLAYELADAVESEPPASVAKVLAARIFTADAYLRSTETAIQCHGGAGFTWEQGLHYWYRAALRLRSVPFSVVDLRRLAADAVWSTLSADAPVPAPVTVA